MSFTIQTRSVFKYLLAGLLVSLLVLNTEALPASRRSLSVDSGFDELDMRGPTVVKKPAAPAKPVAKAPAAPAKPAAKAPAAPVKAAPKKACPGKGIKKRSFYRRAPTSHPSGKSAATLFHGTSSKAAADSAKVVDMSKTHSLGDYHKRGKGCDGGFYLTDSLFAAAQFVCHAPAAMGLPKPDTAYVNQYRWTPPATIKHKGFTSAGASIDKEATASCTNHDILDGPMDGDFDKELHKDFHQYAITNKKAAGYLTFEKQYTIPCANVVAGKALDSSLYQKGQATNGEFAAYANELEGKC